MMGLPRVKGAFLAVLLVMGLALALRLYQLDRLSLSNDESVSWWIGSQPVTDILRGFDVHPPLYYLLLHGWMRVIGDSDWALRLLSAFLGVLAIPVLFKIGTLLGHERLGVGAALLLAVAGFHVGHSQTARMYALYFLLAALAVWCLLLALKQRRRSGWVGFTLAVALLLYTHYVSPFVIVGIIAFGLIVAWPLEGRQVRNLVIAVGCGVLLYAPWLPQQVEHARQVGGDFWLSRPTGSDLLTTLREFMIRSGSVFPPPVKADIRVAPLGVRIPAAVFPTLWYLAHLGLGLLGLVGLWVLWRQDRRLLLALGLLYGVPVGAVFVVSLLATPVYLPRVLIPALLPLLLVLAAPLLLKDRGRVGRVVWPLMGVAMPSMLFGSLVLVNAFSGQDWRKAAALVQHFYQPRDGVVFIASSCELSFRRYFSEDTLEQIPTLGLPHPYPARLRDASRETYAKVHGFHSMNLNEALQALEAFASKRQRLWLVVCQSEFGRRLRLLNLATTWLERNSSARWGAFYHGVRVKLFELKS